MNGRYGFGKIGFDKIGLGKIAFAAILALGSTLAYAHERGHPHRCSVDSGYQLDLHGSAFVFTREQGSPARMSLGGGMLFVDGREVALTPADRERIASFEGELRQLLPEVRKVVVEGVAIAFAALEEVARGLASDPDASIASLRSSHARIRHELDSRPIVFSDATIERIVEPLVTEYVPTIIGGVVSMAVKAAFAGEEKAREMENRIKRMEREIDLRVEKRAKQLEPLIEGMCQRMRRMDAIDNALEYRTPDGKRIEFLDMSHRN